MDSDSRKFLVSQNGFYDDMSMSDALEIRRNQHNALERNRRGNIKKCFHKLRNIIPTTNERMSRAKILKKSKEFINYLIESDVLLEKSIEVYTRKINFMKAQIDKLKSGEIVPSEELKQICLEGMRENLSADVSPFSRKVKMEVESPISADESYSSNNEDYETFCVKSVNMMTNEYVFVEKKPNIGRKGRK